MSTPHPHTSRVAFAWSDAWKSRQFRVLALVTAVLLPVALRSLTVFLQSVELRPGVVLPDPVLRLFEAHDVTWLTFGIIYIGLFAGIALLIPHPRHLMLAINTYILMVIVRIAAMSLVALDPPEGAIPLQDPFVQYFGTGQLLTRDLFFSGHTATLFLLGLSMRRKPLRVVYYAAAAAVGICVLLQHDHYSIDVLAAPFFAYTVFRIACSVQRRAFGISPDTSPSLLT